MSIKADDKWYHVAFGGKDKNEGNVRLINVLDKTMIWAGEAGDRSLWYGGLKRGGERKVSQRIVEKMKKNCFLGNRITNFSTLKRGARFLSGTW